MAENSRIVPPRDHDDETGRFTEQHAPEEFIKAIQDAGGAAGTSEIAERAGAKYDATYKKLRALEDAGEITSTKVGNARLWQVADD